MQVEETAEKAPEMESWQILNRIFPRGRAITVAHYMHCSVDYVRRWMREPENQEGTGQPNPIDRVCHLIDVAFLLNPLGSALIPEFITNHHRQLVEKHQAKGFGGSEARRDAAAEVLQKAVAAVNSLNLDAATNETLVQFIELHQTAGKIIVSVQAELAHRDGRTLREVSR